MSGLRDICGNEHDSELTPDECLREPGHKGLHGGSIGIGWTDEQGRQAATRTLDPDEEFCDKHLINIRRQMDASDKRWQT